MSMTGKYGILRRLLVVCGLALRENEASRLAVAEALRVAALAGAANSGVPAGAIRQAYEVLCAMLAGRVTVLEAEAQLTALEDYKRKEN
jgi:hypothetical protein